MFWVPFPVIVPLAAAALVAAPGKHMPRRLADAIALCTTGFAITGDLFDLFVFFELMSAAAVALCGYKSEELGPVQGALNFAVCNTLGAFLALAGIALLYGKTGALNLAQLAVALGSSPDRV